MPNGGTDIERMSLEQIRAELAGYAPYSATEVVELEEHIARRQRLWQRVDQLLGIRRPAIAKPVAG